MEIPIGFSLDFDRLSILVRRSWSLPSMPAMAAKLIQAIDSGRAGASRIEDILSSDPGLAANLLRSTNLEGDNKSGSVSSIRWAILKARPANIRKLASFIFTDSGGRGGGEHRVFDRLRLARHSYFVANFSSKLLNWKQTQQPFRTQWSPEEVYVAALLHDFVCSHLARIAPAEYRLLEDHARFSEVRISQGFQDLSGHSLMELELEAAKSWRLPTVFAEINAFLDRPMEHEAESMTLACLAYSHAVSEQVGLSLEDWITGTELPQDLKDFVGVPDSVVRGFAKATLASIALALPPERRAVREAEKDVQIDVA